MKLLVMVVLCIMLILVPLQLDSDLQECSEELTIYIDMLKNEITVKEAELANLDVELNELENQYNIMIEENEKITERINSLTKAEQK